MKALELTGTLHAIDQDGRALLVADLVDVHVEIERSSGQVAVSYPYPPAPRYSGRIASLSLDVPRGVAQLLLAPTPRLKGLRRQAMRKGRRGWRSIR